MSGRMVVRTDGGYGALGARIEFANTFDSVTEKLNANGARRFGRENVNDAAANGELSGKLNHFRAGIAGAAEVSDQFFVDELSIFGESFGQREIDVGILIAPESGGDGSDDERDFTVSETVERGGAALENVGVRSLRIPRKAVEGGKDGDASGVAGKNLRERSEGIQREIRRDGWNR